MGTGHSPPGRWRDARQGEPGDRPWPRRGAGAGRPPGGGRGMATAHRTEATGERSGFSGIGEQHHTRGARGRSGDEIGRSSFGLGSAKAPAGVRARRARRRGARPRRGAGKEAAAPGWQRGAGRTSVRASTGAGAAIASRGAARGCRVRDEGRSRERERGGRARAHIGFVGTWQRCARSDSGRRTRRSGVGRRQAGDGAHQDVGVREAG